VSPSVVNTMFFSRPACFSLLLFKRSVIIPLPPSPSTSACSCLLTLLRNDGTVFCLQSCRLDSRPLSPTPASRFFGMNSTCECLTAFPILRHFIDSPVVQNCFPPRFVLVPGHFENDHPSFRPSSRYFFTDFHPSPAGPGPL